MGMMLKCNSCGSVFDAEESSKYVFRNGDRVAMCPHCGETEDFEDMIECGNCGKVIPKDKSYDGLCHECAKDLMSKENIVKYLSDKAYYEEFMTYFMEWFTPETIVEMIYDNFTEECVDYVNSDDDGCLEDFVEYIHNK